VTIVRAAGERLPRSVADAFRSASPYLTEGGGRAYHNGILAAAVIGALRKRGFLTSGHGPVAIDGCQRTISLLTIKGAAALEDLKGARRP
jgi:hypothetical protein